MRIETKVAVILLGERPGLEAESLSAYLAYHPRVGMIESERTVVSNIHKEVRLPLKQVHI